MCHSTFVMVRIQLAGISSRVWVLVINLRHQAWQQVSLTSEPPCLLPLYLLFYFRHFVLKQGLGWGLRRVLALPCTEPGFHPHYHVNWVWWDNSQQVETGDSDGNGHLWLCSSGEAWAIRWPGCL